MNLCRAFCSPCQASKVHPAQHTGGRRRRATSEDPDEKRRKFLERNRGAVSRCRQKRKVWVSSLEKKAEDLNSMNGQLQVYSQSVLDRGETKSLLFESQANLKSQGPSLKSKSCILSKSSLKTFFFTCNDLFNYKSRPWDIRLYLTHIFYLKNK